MLAFLAALSLALALVLHILGHGSAALVLDFTLAGLLCIALHLAFGDRVTGWTRR